MTLHIAKDFLTWGLVEDVYAPYYSLYTTAMMLNGVFGFSVIGQTSFNLTSGSITKGQGTNNANINIGGALTKAVQIPSGTYVVSVSDIDRILAVRSNTNPMLNSGLFRIGGIDSVTNSLLVVPRSWSADPPPPETNVSWKIYESEPVATTTFNTVGNALGGLFYRSWGSATCTRIILQSPHSSGWQVRICSESSTDVNEGNNAQGGVGAKCSVTVGFGGNASGDFAVGGRHTHMAQYYNLTSTHQHGLGGGTLTKVGGTVPGFGGKNAIDPMRYYGWSDDSTGSTVIVCRGHGDNTHENIIVFGIPEDEELPLPTDIMHRLFTFGSTNTSVNGANIDIEPGVQVIDAQIGITWGLGNAPTSLVPGSWCYLAGNAANATIMHDATASDNPYIGKTELYGWDLYAGTYDFFHEYSEQGSIFPMEPRRIGRLPIIRRGRINFNDWTTSNDPGRTWFHITDGMYAPWSGSILP